MFYCIAKEYTDTPGGRYKKDGDFSGEDFRETVLLPKINKLQEGENLHLIFDGAYGYALSFLEEAFGGLARQIGKKTVLEKLEFESNDDPRLVNRVLEYIKAVENG